VYPGIASTAAFFLNETNPAFGSLFQIGWAYAIGIAFAIITCAPTSGGHFNPAITICFATWQGFPWKKVPYYIFAQVFGAFVAGMLLMGQYWEQISAFKAASEAKGLGTVYNGGPASILCTFPGATQNNQGFIFLIEFFVDSFIVRSKIQLWPQFHCHPIFFFGAANIDILGHCYLGNLGSCESIHRSCGRSICHRSCLCCNDLGICRYIHLNEPGS
jgi:glycerol uptake facilitator-like aquaporin